MAISTYAELKTAVALWFDRTDLDSEVPDFVALAEADLRTDLRLQAMEQFATGTLAGETLAHPTRYLEARRLTIGGDNYRFVNPEVYAANATSAQQWFTTIGQSFYILGGASGDAYTLLYWQAFAPFSAAADTNWLLTNHPNVYLWAACKYAAIRMQDAAAEASFTAKYQEAVGRLVSTDKRSAYSGGPLVQRAAISE